MLKTTFILFVIYVTAINAYSRDGYPNYKYQESIRGWMKLHENPGNWKTAVETCKKEEAVLVASQYDEVDDLLIKLAKESDKDIDFLYVGSQTLSGPQDDVNFAENQLNCVVIFANNATKKSVNCNEQYPFVCYALRVEPEDCDFTGAGNREGFPGYHSCNETGGWVKIHPGPNDYDEAKKTCKDEGGEMIDPDDPKFKEIALKLIKAKGSGDNPIYGKTRVTHPHGGFVEKNGRMVYVKNLPPYCTLLYPNGTIDHRVGCDQKVGFICYVPFPEEVITTTTTTSKPDEVIKEDGCGTGQEREGSPGYKKCDDVDGWVKVHPGPNDQDEAKKTCNQEGGELIDPTDPRFKEIAVKLTKKNQLTVFGKNRKPRPDSGFTKEGGKTKFLKKKLDFCTVVYPNGTVDDEVSCEQKAGFICYIPFEDDNICTDEERTGFEGYKGCKDVDGWVKVHPGPNDFNEAKETCEKEGGELVDINDPKFKKITEKLIRVNGTSVYGKNKKISRETGFVKVGEKTRFLRKGHEFCSIMHPDGTVDDEVDCDKKVGFVCYVKYPLVHSCGDDGYQFEETVGSCYKVYSIGKTWGDARKQCQVDGGDLVIIKSEKEATVLQDIYANHDSEYIVNHPTHMWAGIVENSPNNWLTVEAETLEAAGYNEWARGKNSNRSNDEKRQRCGAVSMLGKYFDCWCEVKHGYICQKKVIVSKAIIGPIILHGLGVNLDFNVGLGIFSAPTPQQLNATPK